MKKSGIIIFMMAINYLFSQVVLDPCYHTNEEIKAELDSLQALYPDIVKVDSIGVTLNDNLPIWALKISDNVQVDEDEPSVMFAGQCHAEEVLGVEITIHQIKDILDHRLLQPYNIWIQELEMWFVPTYNPEGLSVVMDGSDTAFRKNKRDNDGDGLFTFVAGPGNDIDGVDLNRNYGFNWVHGDTLYHEGGEERYDYYRGPAPFSEGGTQAIVNLAEQQHFIFSINWHSSRTGNLSEKVFYPSEHSPDKRSPDFDVAQDIGNTVASLIVKEGGIGTYEPSPSRARKGSAHEWFYQKHGTIQYLIECGTSNLQPSAPLVYDTCERTSVGAYYLLNRCIGYQTDAPMIKGHVYDESGAPLEGAEIVIENKDASFFEPRTTDQFGAFYRPLLPGTYTVKIKRFDTEELVEDVVVNPTFPTQKDFYLTMKPVHSVSGSVLNDGLWTNATLVVDNNGKKEVHNITTNGFNLELVEGEHEYVAYCDGAIPLKGMISVPENDSLELFFQIARPVYEHDFSNGTNGWSAIGNWISGEDSNGQFIKTGEYQFYEDNTSYFMITNDVIDVSAASDSSMLVIDHHYYTEHDYDICSIKISDDGTNWTTLESFSGIKQDNFKTVIPVSELPSSFYLSFELTSDGTLNDPGWKLYSVKVLEIDPTGIGGEDIVVNSIELLKNYPNPFNPETKIQFRVNKNNTPVKISIFNVQGKHVTDITNEKYDKGIHSITWNAKNLSSGVYFINLQSFGTKIDKKILLQK